MMRDLARRLDQHLRDAGLAIDGVSIGDPAERSTWRVHPASLQADAQPLIESYTPPTPADVLNEEAARDIDERKLRAVVLALYECIPVPTMTKAQLRARMIAIYKTP